MPSIYIQIASYRDPDLTNTVEDIVKKSSGKNKIRIGVIDQVCKDDEYYDFDGPLTY